jgi:hypothetical protein
MVLSFPPSFEFDWLNWFVVYRGHERIPNGQDYVPCNRNCRRDMLRVSWILVVNCWGDLATFRFLTIFNEPKHVEAGVVAWKTLAIQGFARYIG